MKICSNCGSQGSGSFCTQCGGTMMESLGDNSRSSSMVNSSLKNQNQGLLNNQNSSFSNYFTSSNRVNDTEGNYQPSSNYSPSNSQLPLYQVSLNNGFVLPVEFQPISPVGYLGYGLLFGIPTIGFIVALIVGFGGTNNINLRNYARGMAIPGLIINGLFLIILLLVVASK